MCFEYRTLDLFCGGAGGWTLGLHRAGFTTVAACEIDPWRRGVFGRNNPGVVLYDDIRTLTADRLLRDIGYLPEIVCGSPPCQDASVASARRRGVDGERTGLFLDAVRIVREVRPRWVLLENVPGLRTRGYDRVHDELEAAGYAIWPLVVGAIHAGAPHRRQRVWIIAADADRARRLPQRATLGETLAAPARQTAERDLMADGDGWAGRTHRIGRVDDGLSARLDAIRVRSDGRRPDKRLGRPSRQLKTTGVARNIIAAYGDAVVPQIVTALGSVIRSIELGVAIE